MPNYRARVDVTVLGSTYTQVTDITYDAAVIAEIDLPAAKTGTLTTRTDDDTGVLTMTAGHGFLSNTRVDVYWSGGSRYGMDIGTVATNSVPIDGGTGDVLPSTSTAITAMIPNEEAFLIDGDEIVAFAAFCQAAQGTVVVCTVNTDVVAYQLAATGGDSTYWHNELPGTSPFASASITRVLLSHGDSANTRKLRVAACRL